MQQSAQSAEGHHHRAFKRLDKPNYKCHILQKSVCSKSVSFSGMKGKVKNIPQMDNFEE